MSFYTNIKYDKYSKMMYCREYDNNGNSTVVKRTYYAPKWEKSPTPTQHKDEFGDYVEPIKGVTPTCRSLGSTEFCFLLEEFGDQNLRIDYKKVNVGWYDIETEAEKVFGMDYPVNVISIYFTLTNELYVLSKTDKQYNPIKLEDLEGLTKIKPIIRQKNFDDEATLLRAFCKIVSQVKPDYMLGWNIDAFDTVVIASRCRALGILDEFESIPKSISPNFAFSLKQKIDKTTGKVNYEVVDTDFIEFVDYMRVIKSKSDQATANSISGYSLNAVLDRYMKTSKLEYDGHIWDFWRNDIRKYIIYNIIDVLRMVELEDVTHSFEFYINMANRAFCTATDVFGSVKKIEQIITKHNFFKHDVAVFGQSNKGDYAEQIPGAYVFARTGLYKNVISFDVASMYVHLIQMYNIGHNSTIWCDPKNVKDWVRCITDKGETFWLEPDTRVVYRMSEYEREMAGVAAQIADKRVFLANKGWCNFYSHVCPTGMDPLDIKELPISKDMGIWQKTKLRSPCVSMTEAYYDMRKRVKKVYQIFEYLELSKIDKPIHEFMETCDVKKMSKHFKVTEEVFNELKQLVLDNPNKSVISNWKEEEQAIKTVLVSVYGIMLSGACKLFSVNSGKAITQTGSYLIQYLASTFRDFVGSPEFEANKHLFEVAEDINYEEMVVLVDTDSNYICIDQLKPKHIDESVDAEGYTKWLQTVEDILNGYLERRIDEYAKRWDIENKIDFKSEKVSRSMFVQQNKHYCSDVIFNEGNRVDKLSTTGMITANAFAPFVRDILMTSVKMLMKLGNPTQALGQISIYLEEKYEEFKKKPIVDIGKRMKLKEYERFKHITLDMIERNDAMCKGLTAQIKGAILWNTYASELGLPSLESGDMMSIVPMKLKKVNDPIERISIPLKLTNMDLIPEDIEFDVDRIWCDIIEDEVNDWFGRLNWNKISTTASRAVEAGKEALRLRSGLRSSTKFSAPTVAAGVSYFSLD